MELICHIRNNIAETLPQRYGAGWELTAFEKTIQSHKRSTWFLQGSLNQKETELNLCNIVSVLIFIELY